MHEAPPYPSPPIEDAKRQYVELFGSALVMNTYLKIALLCVSGIAAGLLILNFRTERKYEHLKPLVVRIDDVGRAQAVQYDDLTYKPRGQAPELKYFLTQFVTKHFARIRSNVKAQYAESLFFLDSTLADATIAQDQHDHTIENFLAGSDDEVDIEVKNVTLDDLRAAPYKATVEFDKVIVGAGNHLTRARQSCVAQLTFNLRDQIPNTMVPVNPLGIVITYFRVDQAFQ